MPYSNCPAPLIMPDTLEGRERARREFPGVPLGLCVYWKKSRDPKVCAARQYEGDRIHNWCLRCLYGYPYANLTRKEQDAADIGGVIRL